MTTTERRADKIVAALSPKEYVLFDIAQALTFDSDEEWFSASDEYKDERSAEASRAHSTFIRRTIHQFLPVVADQRIRDASFESQFLRRLWGDCNLYVDDVIKEMRPRVMLLAEQQMRALLELRHEKSTGYRGDAEKLLEDLLQPRFAIATIRRQRFENRPILFRQYGKELCRLIVAAKNAAATHNKIDQLERTMGGQGHLSRVDVCEVKLAATKSSDALVDSWVRSAKSRARADLRHNKREIEILISELKRKLA